MIILSILSALCGVIVGLFIVYYLFLFYGLAQNEYDGTKKNFLVDLIPFKKWIRYILISYGKLD